MHVCKMEGDLQGVIFSYHSSRTHVEQCSFCSSFLPPLTVVDILVPEKKKGKLFFSTCRSIHLSLLTVALRKTIYLYNWFNIRLNNLIFIFLLPAKKIIYFNAEWREDAGQAMIEDGEIRGLEQANPKKLGFHQTPIWRRY